MVSASLKSYLSSRGSRKTSMFTFGTNGDGSDPHSDQYPFAGAKASAHKHSGSPRSAAAHAASAETERAQKIGAGDEGFAMHSIRGDKNTANHGIKKTIHIDVNHESQGSLGLGNSEASEGQKSFV